MHTTFNDPSSSGPNFRARAVVDQKYQGQIGLVFKEVLTLVKR